ncbi:Fur family transcriptional regulator, partial [Chloroflexota bacterium]
ILHYDSIMWLDYSLKTLRSNGYKITRPRRKILDILDQMDKPLSPYGIQKLLRDDGNYLDHVTIYRILDLLCTLNLAHRVLSVGGFKKCTLNDEEGCHRYMICRICGDLQEFADTALCDMENKVADKFGFQTEHHQTEFSGVCSFCRSQSSSNES